MKSTPDRTAALDHEPWERRERHDLCGSCGELRGFQDGSNGGFGNRPEISILETMRYWKGVL